MRWTPGILGIVLLGACADASGPNVPSVRNTLPESGSEGRGVFHRYTAIGTSVSMGWQSDGVVAASQRDSWPAQLARLAGREMTQPYIDGFGCRAPLAAPLATGRRTSGEPAAGPTGSFLCAPLVLGAALPTQNVALAGATMLNALTTTPETQSDPFWSKMYPRVLPAGTTTLRAAVGRQPKLVSVELGANEVLGARSGVPIPGVTISSPSPSSRRCIRRTPTPWLRPRRAASSWGSSTTWRPSPRSGAAPSSGTTVSPSSRLFTSMQREKPGLFPTSPAWIGKLTSTPWSPPQSWIPSGKTVVAGRTYWRSPSPAAPRSRGALPVD